jgi:hypothetical protein
MNKKTDFQVKECTEVAEGYMHPDYAESLREFGTPRQLPHCGGWILTRQIPGFSYSDAMGCYPSFACSNWSQIHTDLSYLKDELVCLSLVTDPFAEISAAYLEQHFDRVMPFKEHLIADLTQPIESIASKHHRKNARRALERVQVEKCIEPSSHLDEWIELYQSLIDKHDIKDMRRFSKHSFAKQLNIPGLVMFRVLFEGYTIGASLIFIQGQTAYCHLSAFSSQGYKLGAPYAVKWASIRNLIDQKVQWLNLGASAGIDKSSTDGLSKFKQGWATGTRTVYFCGRIFDQDKYSQILEEKRISNTDFFPAYRVGEFK